ncbi:MAG: methyltransferase domain-containing protein [Pseudomonadota bacterium]
MMKNGIKSGRVSVSDNVEIEDFKQWTQQAVLDVRCVEAFQQCHLVNSYNIPLAEIHERIYELPRRDKPLLVIVDPSEKNQLILTLNAITYKLYKCLTITELQWQKLQQRQLTETGKSFSYLWEPNFLLRESLETLGEKVTGRQALDLACGSGRDAVYLALQQWQVTAIDYQSSHLDKVEQLAKRLETSISTQCLNLESDKLPLWNASFDLIIVMRYLHRPLWPRLKAWLKPGGALIMQTFLEGAEKFGKPKNPRYLLKEHELNRTFSGYHIERDTCDYLEDGRPVNSFVAIKRNLL